MRTEDTLRCLAESGDTAAMASLHREAVRNQDPLLMDYVRQVVSQRIQTLEEDLELLRGCLGGYALP